MTGDNRNRNRSIRPLRDTDKTVSVVAVQSGPVCFKSCAQGVDGRQELGFLLVLA